MSVIGSNILAGASGQGGAGGYEIERSLRFNSGDSAYLNRTPSSAGNQKTFTWSGWIKRTEFGGNKTFFSSATSNTSNPRTDWQFYDDTLYVTFNPSGSSWLNVRTSRVLRDPSAWYHIVIAVDTTQGTNTDRVKIYVNGVRETSFLEYSTLTQNLEVHINSAVQHSIGRYEAGDTNYFPGYLADVHFIDGQALAPTDFGEFDTNGVWQPKQFDGSYGTAEQDGTSSPYVFTNFDTTPNAQSNVLYLNSNPDSSSYPLIQSNTSTNNTIRVKFASAQTGVTSIKFRGGGYSASSTYDLFVNGTQIGGTHSTNSGWVEDSHTISSTDITEIKIVGSDGFALGQLKFNDTLVSGTPSYGTSAAGLNSFYLNFSDNSSNAALGTDTSGNNNTWTVANLSVAAGANNDSLVDTPTNGTQTDTGAGGEVVGNYATFNPLDKTSGITLSDGNLKATGQANGSDRVRGTIAIPRSGKWYFEFTLGSAFYGYIGISNIDGTKLVGRNEDGRKYTEAGHVSTPFASITAGDVVGVALDNNTTLTFYKNGVAESTTVTVDSNTDYFAMANFYNAIYILNSGQRAFAYTAPSGYKALCTSSLPTPTIEDGTKYFDTVLYTGNGSTQSITGLGFSPDFVWLKGRNVAYHHRLFDVIRGQSSLSSDRTNAEGTSGNSSLTSFDTNGFSITQTSDESYNQSTKTYVGWAWDAGTSTDTNNTAGSITPTGVRANASAGFSIVSWTCNGSTNQTIGHGLNATPEFMIFKNRDRATNWTVFHKSVTTTTQKVLYLNSTAAVADYSGGSSTWWNALPTSSVFSVGDTSTAVNHTNGDKMITYCFAPVEGHSAMGLYVGNGSADGPFVFTGFKVAWLMVKNASTSGETWTIYDAARDPHNLATNRLQPNAADEETSGTAARDKDFLSNGFKIRGTSGEQNTNGNNYIYVAFAENPFASNGGLAR